MRPGRIAAIVLGVVVLAVASAAFAIVWRPAISPISSGANSFDAAVIKRGRELAAIGNCRDCHTTRDGRDFAGGLPVGTPFGTIYSSNITPDPDDGIGLWSEAAFRRAMRSGVDRAGHHLYPTFPYDHFTNVSETDDRALYAFLMTREPVRAAQPPNQLSFPFNIRATVAGWKLLFLRQHTFAPDPAKSPQWNRGAYLVEGLAHCGACHTPRNALGAEKVDAKFGGGEADNWRAYALNDNPDATVPWDEEALYQYLRTGWQRDHGTARGPMAEVVSNLSTVPDSDVRAIATYMADMSRHGDRTAPPQAAPQTADLSAGATIYAAACASCHDESRPLPYGGIDLARSTGVSSPDPRNLINTVLAGVPAVEGERSPIMPGFADSMTDAQIAELVAYLRDHFGKRPAWPNLERTVREARGSQTAFLQNSAAPRNAPAEANQRDRP